MHARLLAALVRLEYGDLLEAFAARAASAIAAPTESVVASDYAHARIARLHSDAYRGLWTSAHAQFVAAAADYIVAEREAPRAWRAPSAAGRAPPPLRPRRTATWRRPWRSRGDARRCRVRAAHGAVRVQPARPGPLRERGSNARCAKPAAAALTLLTRCTNAGSRGWETALAAALAASEGVAVCASTR